MGKLTYNKLFKKGLNAFNNKYATAEEKKLLDKSFKQLCFICGKHAKEEIYTKPVCKKHYEAIEELDERDKQLLYAKLEMGLTFQRIGEISNPLRTRQAVHEYFYKLINNL